VAATGQAVQAESPSQLAQRDPRPFLWLLSLACLAPVVWQGLAHVSLIESDLADLAPWAILIALANFLPLSVWKATKLDFSPDTPVKIAGMLVLHPAEIALVSFIAAFDRKELSGEVSFTKALFNRSQFGLNAFLGSLVAHALMAQPASSPYVLALAVLSLCVLYFSNCILVGLAVSADRGHSFRHVIFRLRVGSIYDNVVTLILWAVLGAVLAALYEESRPLAFLALLATTFLGRQVLARSQMLVDTSKAYRSREQALQQISRQIGQERSEERRLIAAELHDEVLQPLFKVTLMAEVLKNDLATGRLLELDQDLPELLTGADVASTTLRELIGDLRRSALGRGGLGPALRRFLQSMAERSTCRIHDQVEAVEVNPDLELVIYQIAKEAVTNALSHSKAHSVWVLLRQDSKWVELTVRDDGIGFDPTSIPEGHYGLDIMRERAGAVGADFGLESSPGRGSILTMTVARSARDD
jgi:signal transduction histidine kinase